MGQLTEYAVSLYGLGIGLDQYSDDFMLQAGLSLVMCLMQGEY